MLSCILICDNKNFSPIIFSVGGGDLFSAFLTFLLRKNKITQPIILLLRIDICVLFRMAGFIPQKLLLSVIQQSSFYLQNMATMKRSCGPISALFRQITTRVELSIAARPRHTTAVDNLHTRTSWKKKSSPNSLKQLSKIILSYMIIIQNSRTKQIE